MTVSNIMVERIIAHEVVRASQLQSDRPPVLSDELIVLDAHGKTLIGKRLVETISSDSHCVDVTVDNAVADSPFDKASAMLDADDVGFVSISSELANLLSTAQTSGAIKSGSVIFLQGWCREDEQMVRFIAIIKADSDQGFSKTTQGDGISLVYVGDMVLGESQRLIKVAMLIEQRGGVGLPRPRQSSDFSVKIFDHMMQNSGNANAAVYFYRTFLRCRLADGASRQTKIFYETARAFIDSLPIEPAERLELRGDLISYLRGNAATILARSFATECLPAAHQDEFVNVCRSKGMDHGISKNLDLLKGKLRRQSMRFSSSVTVFASPEAMRDSVKIEDSAVEGWTSLRIRGSIQDMS